jgi:hypothetical protein
MKGRFERAEQERRQLLDRIDGLSRIIETMQQAPAPAPSPAVITQAERLITPEEERDYGPEFLEVVGKKAQEIVGPIVAKYEQRMTELQNRLDGVSSTVVQNTREKMHSALDKDVPKWRDLNRDPDFLDWLSRPDTLSGQPRQTLLTNAYNANDAARVAAFFAGFQREASAVAPQGDQPAPRGRASAPPKNSLEAYAAPGRGKSAAPPTGPDDKPIITRADVTQFYIDVRTGKYRGREQDQLRDEAMIFEAQRENRIR